MLFFIMKKKSIAILGATSHIAKGLIARFLKDKECRLHLYTRSPGKLRVFLTRIGKPSVNRCVVHEGYRNFTKSRYDVLINCVGAGTERKLQGNYSNWFILTEEYDNLAIECLRKACPNALYISFSSGVVYGNKFLAPAEENTINKIDVNHIAVEQYYAIAKLNAEVKHRSFKDLRIVDLRIFSYFSRFIDLNDEYFIAEALSCVLNKRVFVTSGVNFTRDYIHPQDLYSLIGKCMNAGEINQAFDVISAGSVEKKEILDYFSLEYGLKCIVTRFFTHFSLTGEKNMYCSNYNSAAKIGYRPAFRSIDTIKDESKYIINGRIDEAY